jgi:predicted transposase YbfD/YdcC
VPEHILTHIYTGKISVTIDAVVSIDAIGIQIKIAEQIIDQKGHYFLSVKGNQQGLLDDVEQAFKVNKGRINIA